MFDKIKVGDTVFEIRLGTVLTITKTTVKRCESFYNGCLLGNRIDITTMTHNDYSGSDKNNMLIHEWNRHNVLVQSLDSDCIEYNGVSVNLHNYYSEAE